MFKFNANGFLRVRPSQDSCLPQSELKRIRLKNPGNYKQNTISHALKSHQNSGETKSSSVCNKIVVIILSIFTIKMFIFKFIILKKLFLLFKTQKFLFYF